MLVVRKAVSLVLSVAGLGIKNPGREHNPKIDMFMMWSGASMVLIGTIAYSLASTKGLGEKKEVKEKKE